MTLLNLLLLLSLVVVFYLLEDMSFLTQYHPFMPTPLTPNPGYTWVSCPLHSMVYMYVQFFYKES